MIERILKRSKLIWRNSTFGKVSKAPDALKWGIIGTGYMSDIFSRTLTESHNNVLYAVASRSEDKAKTFARKHGSPKAFDSVEDMLQRPEIDVVYIATPVECHFEQTKKCLQAGKNVLCEKPLTFTPQDAEVLFHIAKEHGCFLMEGLWSLCLPTMQTAKDWISGGRIGEVKYVRADLNKRQNIEHIRKHHGVLFDYGIYGVAFINSFMPNGFELSSASLLRTSDNIITDLSAIFKTDQCKGVLNLASNLNSQSKAVVIGTKGSIEWESPFNRTNTVILYDNHGQRVDRYSTHYFSEGFEYELDEVYRNIKLQKLESPYVSADETQAVLHTINKLLNEQ